MTKRKIKTTKKKLNAAWDPGARPGAVAGREQAVCGLADAAARGSPPAMDARPPLPQMPAVEEEDTGEWSMGARAVSATFLTYSK